MDAVGAHDPTATPRKGDADRLCTKVFKWLFWLGLLL
jgi:hypothetical protein